MKLVLILLIALTQNSFSLEWIGSYDTPGNGRGVAISLLKMKPTLGIRKNEFMTSGELCKKLGLAFTPVKGVAERSVHDN